MTQEADFCGDRLRLSAFLRVVAEGLPQRPTRFRRRVVDPNHSLDSSTQRDSSLLDAKSPSDQAPALEQYPENAILKVVRSPSLQAPELAAEDLRFASQNGSNPQSDCSQREHVQHSPAQKQSVKRSSSPTTLKPSQKPRKISSTRKRGHLPVNELALLRTMSSDGLPLPSDANHIFAVPVATLDPIEDSQIRSATPLKDAGGLHRSHRAEKLSPARAVEPGRPALLLRERFAHICSAKSQGPQSSTSSGHKFATGSDGFAGTELHIQHPASQRRPRTSNRTLKEKKSACNMSELTLASGCLPAPPVEHQHNVLITADSRLHTAGSRAVGTAIMADQSQRDIAYNTMAVTEKVARERLRSRTQRHDDVVRGHTAPGRHTTENSSSDNADDAATHSHGASLEAGQVNKQSTPRWLRTPSTGCAYDFFEDERYYERAMCDLNVEARSDSVNGEFWSQYGGLERCDGDWDAADATTSHYL
ncbi:hypothetical protein E8E11_006319 [Didymella keratinophila]|nr:hypothetical protein E8E11_006319 [Didymella keratinophila]